MGNSDVFMAIEQYTIFYDDVNELKIVTVHIMKLFDKLQEILFSHKNRLGK